MNTQPNPETDDSKWELSLKNGFTPLIEYCYANDMAKIERELAAVTAQRDEAREQLAAERALADRLASQLKPLLIATWREKPPTKAGLAFYAWVEARSK
jgi:hypothetical protein